MPHTKTSAVKTGSGTSNSTKRSGTNAPAGKPKSPESLLNFRSGYYETALAGLSVASLQALQEWMGFTGREVGEIMGMSESTLLRRYKDPEGPLTREESDRLVDLMRVLREGYQLYGNPELFRQWLHTPLRVLDGKVPITMLWSSTGRNRLREVFGQLQHGYTF